MNTELKRLNPGNEVLTVAKSALWIGLAGLIVGIVLTVWWAQTATGDTLSFGLFAVLVCPMFGSILGTLGAGGSVAAVRLAARSESSKAPVHLYAGLAFGATATALMLLLQVFTLTLGTVAITVGVGGLLGLFGYWYVAPRLTGRA